jgi:hypothetical protein
MLSQESKKSEWLSKKRQMQGAQLSRNDPVTGAIAATQQLVSFCDAITFSPAIFSVQLMKPAGLIDKPGSKIANFCRKMSSPVCIKNMAFPGPILLTDSNKLTTFVTF